MSAAKKCDRCDKFYEKNEGINGKRWDRTHRLAYVKVMTTDGTCDSVYDLCDECLEKLIRFLNNENEIDIIARSCSTCKYCGSGNDFCNNCGSGYSNWEAKE